MDCNARARQRFERAGCEVPFGGLPDEIKPATGHINDAEEFHEPLSVVRNAQRRLRHVGHLLNALWIQKLMYDEY